VHTVSETDVFKKRADALLSQDEHDELIDFLSMHPTAGDIIPGTGGVRKVRWAAKGKGKSGGVRVIFYHYDEARPIYALLIYSKGERVNLSPSQKTLVAGSARQIKDAARKRKSK
jgi:hypothetical protein